MDQAKSPNSNAIIDRAASSAKPGGASPALRTLADDCKPREKMRKYGCESLTDRDLLAIILRTGTAGCNVLDLADKILQEYGSSLHELSGVSLDELAGKGFPGLGLVKAELLSASLELARRVAKPRERMKAIVTPEDVHELLRPVLMNRETEIFVVIPLDRKSRMKCAPVRVSNGTVDSSLAHPREVFRECVRLSAVSAIVAHNHPSGDTRPSSEDLRVTRQLIEAGKVLSIPLIDHIIIGSEVNDPERPERNRKGYLSIRASGLVDFD